MPTQTFAFSNYYAVVLALCWQRLGVSACAQFEIFVVKVGSTCENKPDLDEKRMFHYKVSKKLSEATNSWARIGCLCLCPIKNVYLQKQPRMA